MTDLTHYVKKPLVVIIVFAVLVRIGVLLLVPDALVADPDDYRRLAENLVEYGTFGHDATPTAYRPPLYPLLLVRCVTTDCCTRAAIGGLHVLLGALTVLMVFHLGNRWGLSQRSAALAALLVACDPILLFQSTRIMTETAATFFAVLGLTALTWCGKRLNDGWPVAYLAVAASGAVLALGALCRPAALVWIAAVGVVIALRAWRNRGHRPVVALALPAAFALGVVVTLAPWTIRNQLQFGRPIATTTHGGYTLLLANNPDFYAWLRTARWGEPWWGDEFNAQWNRRRPRDELVADRLAYDDAWRTIASEPATFAYSCLVRLGRLWSPLPHRLDAHESPVRLAARCAVAVWYVLEYLLAAAGLILLWRVRHRVRRDTAGDGARLPITWLWGILLVLSLTCVHALYWTDMRMRAAAMPVVALAAAYAVCKKTNRRVVR